MIKNLKKFLPKYLDIIEGKRSANYIQTKKIEKIINDKYTIEKLWKIHDKRILNNNYKLNNKTSLLDLKIELSSRIFKNCVFCENRCRIDRTKSTGKCNIKKSKIASEFIHYGEEKILIPSYTIFFSGCTFKCIFCQNWSISQRNFGNYIEPKKLAKIITNRQKQGIRNVNWVGGDPTPNVNYILETLKYCNSNIPQIWNSNMYCSMETMKLINNIIDLYLTDFKYGNDNCAENLSKIKNYSNIIKRNHKIAYKKGEIIIRHLVLPNHIECCSKPILKWISKNIKNSLINIMNQYRPEFNSVNDKEIGGYVREDEFYDLKKYAKELKINEI